MKKAVAKRLRMTKNGKIIRRKMSQGHFRANKSGKSIQGKRGSATVHISDYKRMRKYFGSGLSR